MAAKGWSTPFEDPIPLPRGRQLTTLQDAASYIMKLPKAERNNEAWQTAITCLIMARLACLSSHATGKSSTV